MALCSVEDIAVQYCFFDILLTSLSPRNCIPPEVLLRVSMHSACSTSENALEKPLDIRKLDNSSISKYPSVCATLNLLPSVEHLEMLVFTSSGRLEWTLCSLGNGKSVTASNEQLEQMILRNQISSSFLDSGTYGVGETEFCTPGVIKEGAGPELICTGAGGDTGLGDERSMTEVSVKEQMKKLVG
ncbi:hypothetical protein Tco_0794450 [Tanacetum coccineum]